MKPLWIQPLRVRVDLWVMGMKGYSILPQSFTIRCCYCYTQDTTFFVGCFFSPLWRRYSWHILSLNDKVACIFGECKFSHQSTNIAKLCISKSQCLNLWKETQDFESWFSTKENPTEKIGIINLPIPSILLLILCQSMYVE